MKLQVFTSCIYRKDFKNNIKKLTVNVLFNGCLFIIHCLKGRFWWNEIFLFGSEKCNNIPTHEPAVNQIYTTHEDEVPATGPQTMTSHYQTIENGDVYCYLISSQQLVISTVQNQKMDI